MITFTTNFMQSARKIKISRKAEKSLASPNGLALLPKCTLAGAWLRAAGFEIGDTVLIEVQQGQLIIKKQE